MFLYSHNVLAGIILTIVGCSGLIFNSFILYKIMFESVFGRTFGYIWSSRGVAHMGESLVFCCIIGPLTLIDPEKFDSVFVQRLVHSIYFFCSSVVFFNFLTAVNRMIMVYKPLMYSSIFARSRTIAYTGICWLLGLLLATPNVIDPCQQTPLNSDLSYYIRIDNCSLLVHFLDILFLPIALFSTIIVDVVALLKLYRLPRVRRSVSNPVNVEASRRTEMQLCYMILVECISSLLMFLSLRLGFLVHQEFVQFLLTTFAWGVYSSVDALIVIIFSVDMHTIRRRKVRPRTNTISSVVHF
ncbi:hypothetical protein QR680_007166 [Steinernema hermaphroditum]|uniref:7TM GPCR serpentine receptor class x (Srx) domain-containing protein n=1 Tax=Steinernema hermaphroditum TaxID=289476 RepID=A0AA39HXU9_9BILA|nr:hypothetical protein QR680_007166 [Steinernema hermaphroditum]